MSDIRFYHMQKQTLEQVLPELLAKALAAGKKIAIICKNAETIPALSQHLWVCRRDDVFPHASAQDPLDTHALCPIWLHDDAQNPPVPNGADTLVLIDGATSQNISDFTVVCEMLDGHDDFALQAARDRYKLYQNDGHTVTYWQQKAGGGWEKKA